MASRFKAVSLPHHLGRGSNASEAEAAETARLRPEREPKIQIGRANGGRCRHRLWSIVMRRGAATSAVKAIAELGQDNPETDGNEIDTNVLVALVEWPPVRLRKLDDAGLSTFRAF
jgi:hypothetical protein